MPAPEAATRIPRVLSIPAGAPFLPTLASALCDGHLVEGFAYGGEPLKLASATIFVPTRRAARELRSAFLDAIGSETVILPRIRPLGEFSDDAAFFGDETAAFLDLPPPVPPPDRMLMLAELVRAWKRHLGAAELGLYGEEEIVAPASTADALRLAGDLSELMDQVENEEANWAELAALAPDDLAAWWQITLAFLTIVSVSWPKALAERGRMDPLAHRNRLIDLETARLAAAPPAGPVIVAGSTGSIPATARLIRAVAQLPQGAVVLPGLDFDLDDAAFAMLTAADRPASIHGHPQFGLAMLLQRMGIARRDVASIGSAPAALAARGHVVSEALRPAETTEAWADLRREPSIGALNDVAILEAGNEREEALAIAIALREAIREPGRAAALVTPDRALARRVAGELQRFGIEADDSGGAPFSTTLPGGLARLIVAAAFGPVDPAGLLTLLKHPLVRLSLDRAEMRARAELFERVAMRGGVGRPDPLALTDFFETRLSLSSLSNRPPEWSGHVNEEKLAELRAMAAAFDAAMSPLGALRDGRHRLPVFAQALVQAAEALARGPAGDAVPLYDGPAGEAFLSLMRGLIESGERLDCTAAEFPSVLDALVDPVSVKPDPGGHPRVSIWGALEARLQTVDFLVLGGLNEGSWPSVSGDDPFLSRPMKTMMRLAPPERRIGQAAHDFQMAMGAPAVLLTRSARSEGAPTVASRWWQRLVTVAGEDAVQRMRAAGDEKLAWARALDRRSDVPFAPRPEPRPPLAARPKRFSVTEIETLRRDAYAIYARKVLALQPLDPFVRDPDAAERGQLFHDILETFVHEKVDPLADDAQEQLLAIGARHFEAEELPPEVHAVWWPRFAAMAPNIIAWERERAADIAARVVEIGARATEIGDTGVTLSGRADRIDRLKDGSAAILDYKTGTYPSPKQAHILVAPQLPLEGALLQRGAFHGFAPTTPGDLAYVRLKPKGDVQHDSILKIQGSAKTAAELSQQAWEKLEDLVASYNDPAQGYLSRAMPFRQGDIEGDYDHLARVLEWSAGNGEAEEPS